MKTSRICKTGLQLGTNNSLLRVSFGVTLKQYLHNRCEKNHISTVRILLHALPQTTKRMSESHRRAADMYKFVYSLKPTKGGS